MSPEISLSSRLAQKLVSLSIQKELHHRTDKLLNRNKGYILLSSLHHDSLRTSAPINHKYRAIKGTPQVAVAQLTRTLNREDTTEYINTFYQPPSPFDGLPPQLAPLLRKTPFLEHEENDIKNSDYLRFIVQTARNLAAADMVHQLSYYKVLQSFAASVAFAQVCMTSDIKKYFKDNIKRGKVDQITAHANPLRVEHVAHLDTIPSTTENEPERFPLKKSIRNQILLYSIGVFSLRGFKDVMERLMKDKSKVPPSKKKYHSSRTTPFSPHAF